MPEVSIIIVNYNNFNLLKNCIKSIQDKSEEVEYEIIIVDNGSAEIDLDEIGVHFPGVILIKNQLNLGFAKANNIGAGYAKGKYLLFLNNDTLFIENTLKIILRFLRAQNDELIIGCKMLNEDRTLQISTASFPTLFNTLTENYLLYKIFPRSKLFNKYYLNYSGSDNITEVDVVKGAFLFCSEVAFKKLNGFDERFYFYSEETDFCYRFKNGIGKVLYYPLTSIIHFGGATTEQNLWFKYKNQCIARVQLYQKYYNGYRLGIIIFSHYSGLLLRTLVYFLGGIASFNKNLLLKSYYFFRQFFVYPKNLFTS